MLWKLTRAPTVGAGHQLFGLARLPVGVLVSQAEVTVVIGDDDAVGSLLSCWREQSHVSVPELLLVFKIAVLLHRHLTFMVFWDAGRGRGRLCFLLLLALLLRQVGVCVVVAQARSVLVALSTDYKLQH